MDLIIDAFRWILWLFLKGMFFIMDSLYNAMESIAAFDISSSTTLWQWWGILCIFIAFLTFVRIVSLYLKVSLNEDLLDKFNPFQIIVKVGVICTVILFLPMTVSFFTGFASDMIETSSKLFQVENSVIEYVPEHTGNEIIDEYIDEVYATYQGTPSYLIYSSAADGTYPPYQVIDINSSTGLEGWLEGNVPIIGGALAWLLDADGEYYYFPDTTALIFLLVEAAIACYAIVLVSLEFAKRLLDIGFKILISPVPISGLVSVNDESFSRWVRLLAADLMNNFLQILLFKFVLVISSSTAIANLGVIVRTMVFLGGLLCILTGPSSVAQIIGGDGMGAMQSMQAIHTATSFAGGIRAAGSMLTSAAVTAGAAGIYGGGRLLGGRSLGGHDSGDGNGGGPLPGVSGTNGFSPFGGGGGAGGFFDGSGGSMNSSYFREPTEKQMNAAKYMGVDPTGMNRGQLSQALHQAGMEQSYWGDQPRTQESSVAYGMGNFSTSSGGASYSYDNAGIVDSEPVHSGASSAEAAQQNVVPEAPRLTRNNTFARSFANQHPTAAKFSSAMYVASANRILGQKSVSTRRGYVTKNTGFQTASNLYHAMREPAKKPSVNPSDFTRQTPVEEGDDFS